MSTRLCIHVINRITTVTFGRGKVVVFVGTYQPNLQQHLQLIASKLLACLFFLLVVFVVVQKSFVCSLLIVLLFCFVFHTDVDWFITDLNYK
jgi:ABC-type microcin C transport system permease subunit YejE